MLLIGRGAWPRWFRLTTLLLILASFRSWTAADRPLPLSRRPLPRLIQPSEPHATPSWIAASVRGTSPGPGHHDPLDCRLSHVPRDARSGLARLTVKTLPTFIRSYPVGEAHRSDRSSPGADRGAPARSFGSTFLPHVSLAKLLLRQVC